MLTNKRKNVIMGVAQQQKKQGLKGQITMKFYTINHKLFACNRNNENLIDVFITEKAYKTRDNAFKAVQEAIQQRIKYTDYQPTLSSFVIESKSNGSDLKFRIEFEIKEHWVSEYEDDK